MKQIKNGGGRSLLAARWRFSQRKAESLREAILAMKKRDDRPVVWAPFTLVGID